MSDYRELAVEFGEEGRLAGVLTLPSGGAPRLVLALVSAGLVPKFGPFRLYAEVARRLAKEGIATLRFDLGGIGESNPWGHGTLAERTAHDMRTAGDYLRTRFPGTALAVGGLCSGAEDAFRYAAEDGMVRAVIMIDPFAFGSVSATIRFQMHRVRRRILRIAGLFAPYPPAPGTGVVVTYSYMERSEATRAMATLLARGVRVHFLYTGGRSDLFNHPRQLPGMFPTLALGGGVTCDHFPFTDHTQLLQQDRDAIVDAIVTRLATHQVTTQSAVHPSGTW